MCVLGRGHFKAGRMEGRFKVRCVCTLSSGGEVTDVERSKEQFISSAEGKQDWLQGEKRRI